MYPGASVADKVAVSGVDLKVIDAVEFRQQPHDLYVQDGSPQGCNVLSEGRVGRHPSVAHDPERVLRRRVNDLFRTASVPEMNLDELRLVFLERR